MITYLNLTSGLEMRTQWPNAKIVRIQSSHFESHAFWRAVADLDYQFLFDAANEGVELVDCGSRRNEMSRAQWQGVPWIKYAYARCAGGEFSPPKYMLNDFEVTYQSSGHGWRDSAINKLSYVAKMAWHNSLNITTLSFVSTMDGDYDALQKLL